MQKILIPKEKAGLRLDKFLAEEFFTLSRGEINKKIKAGRVKVNNLPSKPSYLLKEHDKLFVELEPVSNTLVPNSEISLNIIAQDENVLFLNKPAHLQVHPSAQEKEVTLVNGLLAKFPKLATVHDNSALAWMRPGIIHRLDKDTSGIMVVAKNQKTFDELKNLFQHRKVTKIYLALVYGHLKEKEGIINKEIARSANYRKQTIANSKTRTKVRPAITHYKVLKEFQSYSLLEVMPKTGRMHQIRVHLASLGHPIAGDHLYANKKYSEKGLNEPKRQLLHAHWLTFELLGKKYEFSAELPQDFTNFLHDLDQEQKKGK